MFLLGFIIGLLIGSTAGIVTTALISADSKEWRSDGDVE